MKEIYGSASNVIVRLGPGNTLLDYAIDRMNSKDFRNQLKTLRLSERSPGSVNITVETVLKNE